MHRKHRVRGTEYILTFTVATHCGTALTSRCSAKKLTILYGEECDDMQQVKQKRNVDAVRVAMPTPFGTHHT